jgi:L-aminoadipate-semialdehyde dehydrogenase
VLEMSAKTLSTVAATVREIFPKLGLSADDPNSGAFWGEWGGSGPILEKHTPIDRTLLASVREASPSDGISVVA